MTKEGQIVENRFKYSPSQEQKEKLKLLHSIVTTLTERGVRYVVAGGYGLDALHGSLTRSHKDYDFVVFDKSEGGFQEAINTLGFHHHGTKKSGTVTFTHNELNVELEYIPSSKLQELLRGAGAKDIDLDSKDNTTNAGLHGVPVPTFNLDTCKMFDLLLSERFEELYAHAAHKQQVYSAIEGRK